MTKHPFVVRVATGNDLHYADQITQEMETSAKARGTGIAKRTPAYIKAKMLEGKAVIAVTKDASWVGFCYIEAWEHGRYVANSGLIVSPEFRGSGVARAIKAEIFKLSRQKFPESKIFGLTTGLAVMKINSALGYKPVTYSELTTDEAFWAGCQSCVNYDILQAKERKNCLCTGMLYDPAEAKTSAVRKAWLGGKASALLRRESRPFAAHLKLYERWMRFKQHLMLGSKKSQDSSI